MTDRRVRTGPVAALSFDLFGTLVSVQDDVDPSAAVRATLEAVGVDVPADWRSLYTHQYIERESGAEIDLIGHVMALLEESGRAVEKPVVREAVIEAFDPDVSTRDGAVDAIDVLADHFPVGILSNCSVPTIAEQALRQSDLDHSRFRAVVTSEGCGWRKPDGRAFRAVADSLGIEPPALVHIGDDPIADTGIEQLGGTSILVDDVPLSNLPEEFRRRGWLQ